MNVLDFDFHLPAGACAREFRIERGQGRLLVLRRAEGLIEHRRVEELPEILEGRPLYANDAAAGKFRIEVELPPKGLPVECVLTDQTGPLEWSAFVKIPLGYGPEDALRVRGGPSARVIYRDPADHSKARIEFDSHVDLDVCGSYPLPPWIERPSEPADWSRYEPLYARVPVSRARATAGACLSSGLLDRLAPNMEYLTLAVALDSYDSPTDDQFATRIGHPEVYILRAAPREGAIAIGSTALRALEAYAYTGILEGTTRIFIAPGHEFRAARGLLTNLHLPMESVLVLTAACGGYDLTMEAYRQAAERGYLFGDWGDSMLIL
jgi:S-adenosylmethionine:tRNA ribosyltransferase-isomerase